MPYSTIAVRRTFTFDKLLELYDLKTAAISTTTSSTAVNAGADDLGITMQKYVTARIQYSYTGFAAGTAEWTASLEASSASGGTYVSLGSIVLNPNAGVIAEISFSGIELCNAVGCDPAVGKPAYLRITFTLTGAAGDLTAGCDLGCY